MEMQRTREMKKKRAKLNFKVNQIISPFLFLLASLERMPFCSEEFKASKKFR